MQVQPAINPTAPEEISYIERAMQALVSRVWELVKPIFLWLGLIAEPPSQEPVSPLPELIAPSPSEPAQPPPVDISVETQILSGLQIGSPSMVFRHFEQFVSPLKQAKIFERLGKEADLSYRDLALNRLWRDSQAQLLRYREIGMEEARLNPYRLAPYLEKAIRKKIAQAAS